MRAALRNARANARPLATGLAAGLVSVSLVSILQIELAGSVGAEYLFLVPVWLAVRLGGRVPGYATALVTAFAVARFHAGGEATRLALEFSIHAVVLCLVVLFFDRLEDRNRTFRRMAFADALTGLPNRRAAQTSGSAMIRRAQAASRPIAVVVVDCDQFKTINDKFGHDAGDRALRHVAKALAGSVRSSDVVSRIGGDEFLLLLSDADTAAADRVVERARRALETAAGSEPFPLSLSFGTAVLGRDGANLTELMRAADARMYRRRTLARRLDGTAVVTPVTDLEARSMTPDR